MFAVSFIGYDGKPRYDPKYVRLIARYEKSGEYTDIPLDDCTEDDWAKFYDPSEKTQTDIQTFEKQWNFTLRDTLKCLHFTDDIVLKPD